MSRSNLRLAVAFFAIALCGGAAHATAPDFTLTAINIENHWPTHENFSFTVDGVGFTIPYTIGTQDLIPSAPLLAKMQDGIDETVRIQVGADFIDRPESFYLQPPGPIPTNDGTVTRWRSELFPPTGVDWTGYRLGRFFIVLGTENGHNNTSIEVHGGAPEPAAWVLMVMVLACFLVVGRYRPNQTSSSRQLPLIGMASRVYGPPAPKLEQ